MERFRTEVKIMQQLVKNSLILQDHPHVIKLYEYFEDDKNVYLVMEYRCGFDLVGSARAGNCLTES